MNALNRHVSPSRQRGVVLVVSLIILLVLVILSLASSKNIVMQEKMTGSSREGALALMSAENAVADAETYLSTLVSTTNFTDNGLGGGNAANKGLFTEGNGPAKSTWLSTGTNYPWEVGRRRAATANISPKVNSSNTSLPVGVYFVVDEGATLATSDPYKGGSLNIEGEGSNQSGAAQGRSFMIVAKGTGRDGVTERVVRAYYSKSM